MNDDFTRKVRSAAIAGWWTVILGFILVTVQWLSYLHVMNSKPAWLLCLWGGADVQWATMQTMWLWFLGIFKLCLILMTFVVIWLTLWARGLRKS